MSAGVMAGATRAWAVSGVAFMFVEAAWRLGERGIITVQSGLSPLEWAALLIVTAAFLYGEGVRALQRRWVPWVLDRVRALPHARVHNNLLAPLYATGLVGTRGHELARAWLGVFAIVAAVIIVSRLPEPWRGIIDLGVAVALSWGLAALLAGGLRTVAGGRS